MVAARYLQRGIDTHVCYLDLGRRSRACEHNLAALRHAAVSLHPFQCRDDLESLATLFGNADVIVDSLLGTGGRGTIREPLATCIRMANAAKAKIIAADIPTPGYAGGPGLCFPPGKIGRGDCGRYRDPS